MIALAALVVSAVVFRKAGMALVWYDEVASILLAWLTYYGAALAALHRRHIGMPTLVARLAPVQRRVALALRELIVIGFFLLAAWAGLRVLAALRGTGLTSLPWVPAVLAQSVIPIGSLLFVLAELAALPDHLREIRTTPEELAGHADVGALTGPTHGPRP